MTPLPPDTKRDRWQTEARRISRRVNLAWWLETLTVPLLIGSIIATAALLLVRRELGNIESWILAASAGGLVALLGLVCWVLAARKFEKPEQSLVRMEAAMGLQNALSAARAGVAPWPEPMAKYNAGLTWHWQRLIIPPLSVLAILAAGLFIPISAKSDESNSLPEQPQTWQQLSNELEQLAQEEVAEEKYLEEMRKKLEELKSQEEEKWFSHASLEATDSLKQSHRAEMERVEQRLEQASEAFEKLQEKDKPLTQEEANQLMQGFDQALKDLQNGALKPNPELLEQMKNLDLKELDNLTPEQIEKMRENFKKHQKCLGDCKGGDGEQGEGEGKGQGGEKEGEGEGEGKDGLGKGDIQRGPGHDPNVLGKEKEAVETGELAGIQAKDLSNAAPGDLLELRDGEHEVDQAPTASSTGGNIDSVGKGGDRVWRDALNPDEQRAVKNFFK